MLDLKQRIQDAFGGRLVVERELGGGGMSRVLLASAVGLRRRVVVKVLPPELSVGVNAERFRREIDLAAQLQHPHIVQLLEVGQGEGLLCYTMPYIEGESLPVSTPNSGRQATDAFRLAEAYLRLGELYEARGDLRNAIARYEDLVELWKNADPDRQSAVAEVRRSISRLRARIG